MKKIAHVSILGREEVKKTVKLFGSYRLLRNQAEKDTEKGDTLVKRFLAPCVIKANERIDYFVMHKEKDLDRLRGLRYSKVEFYGCSEEIEKYIKDRIQWVLR